MARRKRIDHTLLALVLTLTVGGFFIFVSASLGLLAKEGPEYTDIVLKQLVLGLFGGLTLMTIISYIPYRWWKTYAFHLFTFSIALTALLFIPGLGMEHGGSVRWLNLGPFTMQPSELLKLGFIIYFAAWLAYAHKHIQRFAYGLLPYLILLIITGLLLLLQPDTDTFVIIAGVGVAMFFVAGARWRDVFIIIAIGAIAIGGLVTVKPYLMDRVHTYLNPAADPLGSGYQIQQSLIAIGSGEVVGRGFGQSIQKFNFLPEATGDSVFAVAAEEFGFIGSITLIMLYLLFALRGMQIAIRAPDLFARFIVVGIVTLIVGQSMLNIAAMLNVIPLSGMPLLFISHGGTALALTLAEVGIILNISRSMKPKTHV